MNVSTVNSRISTLLKHGFTKEDIKELTNVEGFLWDDDTTKSGKIKSNISSDVYNRLKASVKTWKDISKESKNTLSIDTKKINDKNIVKEFRAKQTIDDYLSELNSKYYDLISSIAAKYKIPADEAESLITYVKNGSKLVKGFSDWGSLWRSEDLSYTKALARLHSLNSKLDVVEDELDKFIKENQGVRPW